MFRIENHIEILLLNHDCVIIPGFGGFVAHHVAAHFDSADGMMLPPSFTVGFNPQLTLNDSLLIQSYADAYDLSYPEASRILEEDVIKIREHILNNGKWFIHSIGELQLDSNGRYQFEPCSTGIVRPSLYALTGIETGLTTNLSPTASEQKLVEIEETEKDNRFIQISRSAIKKTAIACLLIALVVVSALNHDAISTKLQECGISFSSIEQLFHQNKGAQQQKNTTSTAEVKTAAQEKTVASTTETSGDLETANESTDETQDVAQTVEKPFTVVLASQVTLKNADAFISEMKQKGYDDIRLIGESKVSRKIVYGNYSSFEEANEAKRSFNKEPEFKNAWVTEIKH